MFCESDARSYGCDIFPVHLCHVLLCHHCICVHFRRALESQAKRCLHINRHIGLHRLSTAHILHTINTVICKVSAKSLARPRGSTVVPEWGRLPTAEPERHCGFDASALSDPWSTQRITVSFIAVLRSRRDEKNGTSNRMIHSVGQTLLQRLILGFAMSVITMFPRMQD